MLRLRPRRLWLGALGVAFCVSSAAQSLTCPQGAATATADPILVSACSKLSRIVSKEIETGGTAGATVYITYPPTAFPMSGISTTWIASTSTAPTTSTSASPSSSSSSSSGSTTANTNGPRPTSRSQTSHSQTSHSQTSRRPISHGSTSRRQTGSTGAQVTPGPTHSGGNAGGTNAPAAPDGAGASANSSSDSDDDFMTHVVIPVAVVCTVVPVLLIALLIWFCWLRRRRQSTSSPGDSEKPIYSAGGEGELGSSNEKSAPGSGAPTSRSPASATPLQLAYLFGPDDEQEPRPVATAVPLSAPAPAPTSPDQPASSPNSPSNQPWQARTFRAFRRQPAEELASQKRDSDEARGVSGLAALPEETVSSTSVNETGSDVTGQGGTWFASSIQDDDESEPPVPQEPLPSNLKPPPIPEMSPEREKRASNSWLSLHSRHSVNSSVSGPPDPPTVSPPLSNPTSGVSTPRIVEAIRATPMRPTAVPPQFPGR